MARVVTAFRSAIESAVSAGKVELITGGSSGIADVHFSVRVLVAQGENVSVPGLIINLYTREADKTHQ